MSPENDEVAQPQNQRVVDALQSLFAGNEDERGGADLGQLQVQAQLFEARAANARRQLDAAQKVTSEDLAIRVNVVQKRR